MHSRGGHTRPPARAGTSDPTKSLAPILDGYRSWAVSAPGGPLRHVVLFFACSATMAPCHSPTVPSPLDADPHAEGEIDGFDLPVPGLQHVPNIAVRSDEDRGCRNHYSITPETQTWVRRGGVGRRRTGECPGGGGQIRVWLVPGVPAAHIGMCGAPIRADVVAVPRIPYLATGAPPAYGLRATSAE